MFCTEGLCCWSSKQLRRGIDTQSSPLCYRLSRQPSSTAAHETGASQVWRKKLSQNRGSLQIATHAFGVHNRCRKRRRCRRVKSPAFCSVLLPNPKCNRQRQKSQSHDWQRFEVARPGRFELPTLCLEGRRSIQLSYGRILGYSSDSTALATLIRVRLLPKFLEHLEQLRRLGPRSRHQLARLHRDDALTRTPFASRVRTLSRVGVPSKSC